ncbi:MAG: serine/threonine protein kinase [Deltaproteobacteria bacterium]|nr:MAG: serine/threonine protein kinase [Deltaproteobacteria bacterium]
MTFVRLIERGTVLLGKYRVDSVIGRGGMGLVVKAWHLGLDEEVAIKLLRDDAAVADETIARFIREAQAAAKLKSEHIARTIDVGTFGDGKPYLVMEFLEGQDIGQLLAERGRLQPSLAIDLVIQACEALAEAHSLGIIHRDIKPTNLFLTSRPDGSVLLKVLDFGISKSPTGADLSLTQTWSLLGSPAYMSPEQMRSARNVDARTDVWSLGAVLYEAIEGHLPFQAASFSEMCVMVAVEPPTPMAATPRELVPIIARCLAKNPDDRYRSVADLARDLACLAREPDKAQVLVDRMYRVLRRGPMRRTAAAGVPITAEPPGHAGARRAPAGPIGPAVPVTRLGAAGPPGAVGPVAGSGSAGAASPAGIALPGGVAAVPSLRVLHGLARSPEPSPAGGVPVAIAPQGPPARGVLASSSSAMAPLGAALAAPPGYSAAAAYTVSLPMRFDGDARYLRPGFEPPRGGAALATTHVISRRDGGWILAAVVAVLALAAVIAVIAVLRSRAPARPPVDDSPTIVRMNHVPAPPPATDPAVP